MSLTGNGSFRNVPFLVYKEQRERGGRNIVKREYPLRES
ncbi:DNA circularization N-terminal domain-containing protein, partial [Salmonella enterica]|nr:DNA circularization N-terminal domain-containing protein [Salmonella enterica]